MRQHVFFFNCFSSRTQETLESIQVEGVGVYATDRPTIMSNAGDNLKGKVEECLIKFLLGNFVQTMVHLCDYLHKKYLAICNLRSKN